MLDLRTLWCRSLRDYNAVFARKLDKSFSIAAGTVGVAPTAVGFDDIVKLIGGFAHAGISSIRCNGA